MERNPNFLKKKYNLQSAPEVESAATRTSKRTGEKMPQNPSDRIQNYLDRFKEITSRSDPDRRKLGMGALKKVLHNKFVIKQEEIPEAYFTNQQRLAREEGRHLEMWGDEKEQLAETLIEDQTNSLDSWVNYLASENATYPDWLKYYAFRGMLQMGSYDKKKKSFGTRTKETVNPFPELNREALAYVLDAIEKKESKEPIDFSDLREQEKSRLDKLLKEESFAKLYAWAIERATPASNETLSDTRGEWIKYQKGSDHMPLVQSLEGHGTGWCTAGASTAQTQLRGGDFHVYYSFDKSGRPTIPRVAVRMSGYDIAEVRGIASGQNLDPYINDVVSEKLKEFPDGALYEKKVQDMKFLTALERRVNAGEKLTKEDLIFLYEIERKIEDFGEPEGDDGGDPRAYEIREKRNQKEDYAEIFGCLPNQVALEIKDLNDDTVVCEHLIFQYDEEVSARLTELPPNLRHVVRIAAFGDSKITSLGGLKSIGSHADFSNSNVVSLGDLETIGGSTGFSWGCKITSLGNLRSVGGDADFENSLVTNLGKLERIGGTVIVDERSNAILDFSKVKCGRVMVRTDADYKEADADYERQQREWEAVDDGDEF